MIEPNLCTEGYYCPASSDSRLACPTGKFSNMRGLKSINDCQFGAFGKYYDTEGTSSSTNGKNCKAGYKCYVEADNPFFTGFTAEDEVPCIDGEICPAGTSVPQLCAPGSYMSLTGPLESYNCSPCPTDYYCPEWGYTRSTTDDPSSPNPYDQNPCPAGYLCLGGAIDPSNRDDISVQFCPVGYFCNKGNLNGEGLNKQKCPVNFYSPIEGQAECFKCPAGFKCSVTGTVDPEPCPRG